MKEGKVNRQGGRRTNDRAKMFMGLEKKGRNVNVKYGEGDMLG